MPRKTTPSFVVELPLDTTLSDETQLNKKVFEAAKRLNNVLLKEGINIVQAIRNDPAWAAARKLPNADKEQRIVRGQAFQAVRKAHQFTDFDFQAMAITHKNAAGFTGRLGSHTTQKLGTKVFKALERYLLGLSGQPRFKGVKRPLHSIEGKNNAADLRWNEDDGCVYLTASWAIKAVLPDLRKDEWLWSALQNPVKYCRIVRRFVGDKNRFSLQLVMEGLTPMKASVLSRLSANDSKAGIDIGPSNIAWVTETDAGLFKFCADVETPQKLLRVLNVR
jgi:putative transposase